MSDSPVVALIVARRDELLGGPDSVGVQEARLAEMQAEVDVATARLADSQAEVAECDRVLALLVEEVSE